MVEETFTRFAPILHLHVGGQVIRTTGEHPFFANDKGWLKASALQIGDRLLTEAGAWALVEDLLDTGDWEPVFNLRVADYHTYFVGDWSWGFAVWAHNAYTADQATTANTFSRGGYRTVHNSAGNARPYSQVWFVATGTSATEIDRAASVDNATRIGETLRGTAQTFASAWKDQDADTRYDSYHVAILDALASGNTFIEAAGLPLLTLDGIDRGTQQMTMPNATNEFRGAVAQFYRQRGWYMGRYVHKKVKEYYENPAHAITGLVYQSTGPDFKYQPTANGPITYFELLTNTRHSRQTHNDRHGGSLWRAVYTLSERWRPTSAICNDIYVGGIWRDHAETCLCDPNGSRHTMMCHPRGSKSETNTWWGWSLSSARTTTTTSFPDAIWKTVR